MPKMSMQLVNLPTPSTQRTKYVLTVVHITKMGSLNKSSCSLIFYEDVCFSSRQHRESQASVQVTPINPRVFPHSVLHLKVITEINSTSSNNTTLFLVLVSKHTYQLPKKHLQKCAQRQKLETVIKDGRLFHGEVCKTYGSIASQPKREETSRLKNISKLSRSTSSFYHFKSLPVIKTKETPSEGHQQMLTKEHLAKMFYMNWDLRIQDEYHSVM